MTKTPSPDTLEWAASWLEEYEGKDDDGQPDDAAQAMYEVAAWLRARVAAAHEAERIRQIQAAQVAAGKPRPTAAQVRAAMAAIASKGTTP